MRINKLQNVRRMTMKAKPDAKEGQLEADTWVKTTRDKRRRTETLAHFRQLSKESDEGKGRIIYKGLRQVTSRTGSRNYR